MSDPTSTCWTAVKAAAAGDLESRARFVQRYTPIVHAYFTARWREPGRLGDVDDAAQEVFLECFKSGGALAAADPGRAGGFRVFLLGITRNVAARVERRRARRREVALPDASDPPAELAQDETPDEVFDRAWAQAMVEEAGAAQRRRAERHGGDHARWVEILDLRFGDDVPIRTIAERQGRDVAEVHRDYARARREFHLALREVVAFHLPQATTSIDVECRRLLELLRST